MIGLGGIGQRHVRNLRSLLPDGLELLAYRVRQLSHVVTPKLDLDLSRSVEAEYAIRAFGDLAEALACRPDVAFVANPSSLHIGVAIECARAGCDLFIEKPLSNTLEGTSDLVTIVEDRRLVAMVGYQLRFHPCFIRFGEIVRSGALGNLLSVRATIGENLSMWHKYEDYRQMYAARADLGGGVVLSQIHELDYLYALFGLPRRVFALGGHWSDLEIDVEDTASSLMECRVGGRPLPVQLQQDYLQRSPSRSCEVVGDKGKAIMDLIEMTVTTVLDGSRAVVDDYRGFERNDLFIRELEHFLHCVEMRTKPIVTLRNGLASLRMALAVKESMLTGRVVDIESGEMGHAS